MLSHLALAATETIEIFDPQEIGPSVLERIRSITFERIHLVSSVPRWSSKPPEFGTHDLNAPADAHQLSRWLGAAIEYVK